MEGAEGAARPRRGSKLTAVLFWIVAAAVLVRIATVAFHRGGKTEQVGLVNWHPVERAPAVAERDGKPLLYDFTAAWCGPCHRLDKEGWEDSSIAGIVNGSYVAVRVVDREREDGKNAPAIEDLERRYGVSAFPTLVIASADGRQIAKVEGYGGRDRLRRFLENSPRK